MKLHQLQLLTSSLHRQSFDFRGISYHSLYDPQPFFCSPSFPLYDTTIALRYNINTPNMQLLTLLLAAAPALVAAKGSLGFALGDKKSDGTCKFQADYAADFKAISGTSKLVRIYAASDCNTAKEILPAAKAAGAQVVLGIWYA